MSIRRVKQHTDRGNIKDLQPHEVEVELYKGPFTTAELRFKKLYEYSQQHKDAKLQQSMGIITTDYIDDKTALPLSVYRIKKIVEDIKSRSGSQIEKLEEQIAGHLHNPVSEELLDYLSSKRIKTASPRKSPIFRRVSL